MSQLAMEHPDAIGTDFQLCLQCMHLRLDHPPPIRVPSILAFNPTFPHPPRRAVSKAEREGDGDRDRWPREGTVSEEGKGRDSLPNIRHAKGGIPVFPGGGAGGRALTDRAPTVIALEWRRPTLPASINYT